MHSSVICISGESNYISFNTELPRYLLGYGAWEGAVIQLRNSKQRLGATPFTEPHDMLYFLQCNNLEYWQLGRERTLSWTCGPRGQYFLYKMLCNQATLSVVQ